MPMQCCSWSHEKVLEISTKDLSDLQDFFGKSFIPMFIEKLDNWPEKEGFPNKGNPGIYDTAQHKNLFELYKKWSEISEEDKQNQLSDLMVLQSKKKRLEDKLEPINCALSQ